MKRATLWPAAALATLTAGFAAADVDEADFALRTTENLYDLCSVTSDHPDYAPAIYACRSCLEATVQYHDAVSDGKTLKRLICYPSNANLEDARRAFLAWAEANAGNRKVMAEMPVIGVVRALEDKYPCKR
ncbi:MAG: Rap1a/Tai family immunity protein [Thiohalocapsa sp.]